MKERLRKLSGVDFGTLDGSIPSNRKFIPGQLDFIAVRVNRAGRVSVLIVEVKAPGDVSSVGQQRMLKELSTLPNHCVVSVRVSGKLTSKKALWFDPITMRIYKNGVAGEYKSTTLQVFEKKYQSWYRAANR